MTIRKPKPKLYTDDSTIINPPETVEVDPPRIILYDSQDRPLKRAIGFRNDKG